MSRRLRVFYKRVSHLCKPSFTKNSQIVIDFRLPQNMQQALLNFFALVLLHDEKVLKRLSVFEGDMRFDYDANILVFKLSGLHQFFHDEIELDYNEFQKMIYQSNLNEELRALGGRIEVHQSTGNIHDSLYRLVKSG